MIIITISICFQNLRKLQIGGNIQSMH